jgi:hypothetical protein
MNVPEFRRRATMGDSADRRARTLSSFAGRNQLFQLLARKLGCITIIKLAFAI